MSLRLKLTLAFTALVSLIVMVGVTSFGISRGLREEVSGLRPAKGVDLTRVDLAAVSLEVEGFWSAPSREFVATEVDVLPGLRRPKLRGPIQGVDRAQGTITLFGIPISIDDTSEFVDLGGGVDDFDDLYRGQRVELTCDVVDGVWVARKVSTHEVKRTDKVKGSVAPIDHAGARNRRPEVVDLHGLTISLSPLDDVAPDGALGRIELATQMTLALQECRAIAHELVGVVPALRGEMGEAALERDTRVSSSVTERLDQARSDFEHYLREAQLGDADSIAERWLVPLSHRQPLLRRHVEQLAALAVSDPSTARAYLHDELEPFLASDLMWLVSSYMNYAEGQLGDQLASIVTKSEATTRVALATSAAAVLLAVALGFLVWRSIHGPIVALHAAAQRVGQGHLGTRVELRTHDELGDLAAAFNTMAGELARTTVSVASLEHVFDSLAGALVIVDADGTITNVNRATLRLLGYEREELLGLPLERVCKMPADAAPALLTRRSSKRISVAGAASAVGAVGATSAAEMVAGEERVFITKNRKRVPVSFSGAELRQASGPLQGYVCVALDLTERKRMEEGIRDSLQEKDLLLREVHHRVKNNMQVICSMLAMQASEASDNHTVSQFEESQNRIRSMALIHEQLYQASDFSDIDLRGYLETLTLYLSQSFGRAGEVDIDLHVDDVSVDLDCSLACGLIVNELVTNAFKHAFGDGSSGKVHVSVTEAPGGDCVLTVSDDGVGADLSRLFERSNSASLGMVLVESLVKQLRGRISVGNSGRTEVRIVFPARPVQSMVA